MNVVTKLPKHNLNYWVNDLG